MAFTLDELEVKISSNSKGASGGIDTLTNSLRDLAKVTGRSLNSLHDFSVTLKEIASNIKIIDSSSVRGLKNVRDSIKGLTAEQLRGMNMVKSFMFASQEASKESRKFTADMHQKWFDGAMGSYRGKDGMMHFDERPDTSYRSHSFYSQLFGDERYADESIAKVEEVVEAIREAMDIDTAENPVAKYFNDVSDSEAKAQREAKEFLAQMDKIIAGNGLSNISANLNGGETKPLVAPSMKLISMDEIEEDIEYLKDAETRLGIIRDELAEKMQLKLSNGENGIEVVRLADKIHKLDEELLKLRSDTRKPIFVGIKEEFDGFKEGLKNLTSGIGKSFQRITRTVQMRALRSAIRAITSGVGVGIGNLYKWSDAIGGKFSTAMDTAKSQFTFLKNSIATALAPAIEALIPVLTTVVNWFHEASNSVAQFIALLSGNGSWTKATLSMEKYGDATKKASGQTKDLLADWDELNIIQGSNSGNGISDIASDYKDMFEEVTTFDSKVKDVVEWIKDDMELIRDTAIAIGGIVLGWKVSSAFTGTMATVGKLIAGGFTVALGFTLAGNAGYKMGKNGFTAKGIVREIIGLTASAIGGKIIAGAIGASGLTGAVIGLTLGIAISIDAYFRGVADAKKDKLWGDVELSAEEIKAYVQESFGGIDVNAEIESIDFRLKNEKTARDALNKKIRTLSATIDELKIKTSLDEADARRLVTEANGVIDDTNELLATQKKNLKFALGITSDTTEDGKSSLQTEIEARFNSVSDSIKGYVTEVGTKIAGYWDEGIKSGWKNGEADLIMEEIVRYNEIQEAVNNARKLAELETGFNSNRFTRGTTSEIISEDIRLLKEYEDSVYKDYSNSIVDAKAYLAFTEKMRSQFKNDPTRYANWDAEVQKAEEAIDLLLQGEQEIIEERMKPAKEALSRSFMELLSEAMGGLDPEEVAKRMNFLSENKGIGFSADSFWATMFDMSGLDVSREQRQQMMGMFSPEVFAEYIPEFEKFKNGFASKLIQLGYSKGSVFSIFGDMFGVGNAGYQGYFGSEKLTEEIQSAMDDVVIDVKVHPVLENTNGNAYELDSGINPNPSLVMRGVGTQLEVNTDKIGQSVVGGLMKFLPANLTTLMSSQTNYLRQIANKNTTVVVTPSTSLGAVSGISLARYAKMTGE